MTNPANKYNRGRYMKNSTAKNRKAKTTLKERLAAQIYERI